MGTILTMMLKDVTMILNDEQFRQVIDEANRRWGQTEGRKRFDGVQLLVLFFGGCGVGFAIAAIFL